MLPLVLGGIALAAVGYGVKEYCESEGCPWEDETLHPSSAKSNVFETLHKRKINVYETSFMRLYENLLSIKKLKHMPLDVWTETLVEEKLACVDVSSEIKLYVDAYEDVLSRVDYILEVYLKKVETIIQASLDYTDYSKEEKKSLKKIYKFMQNMNDVFALKLLDDNGAMSVDSILALREYSEKVSKSYDEDNIKSL